jgi:hypothetical protein
MTWVHELRYAYLALLALITFAFVFRAVANDD